MVRAAFISRTRTRVLSTWGGVVVVVLGGAGMLTCKMGKGACQMLNG